MSRVSRLLNQTVNVWRYTRTSDGMGGWVAAWVQVGTARARLSQRSARERTAADQTTSRLTHVVYLLPDADVRRGDELRQAGRTFTVLATFEPSEPGTYLRADCEVVQTAA
ncbi:phage head closure protein [Streptomyces chiangmaiensis]|uniref:Phage head closure protein n=1 Tax=Streptomyces chiangmaiensis TaxID=766497 RepID=A0ABU7FF91_9ACTN|nr:phage head closure protein [Streptomyces chiangmaiensis]MED7822589.1 phage head closure protein [Streptomyces chiangmaiensis]